jgi:release factor glutamine methyltransferase
MKVTDVLRQVTLVLRDAGLEEPGREAMFLVREVAGLEQSVILAHAPEISQEVERKVMEAAGRRAGREPIQYITGRVEFMDMTLRVGPGVLVPRPETELLVEEFYRLFPDTQAQLHVLDLCTGSGCIALAIASLYPRARITATDASKEALEYARLNAAELGIGNVRFLHGSLYEPLEEGGTVPFDAIVSNPPYIPAGEIGSLMPEVSGFEPRAALDGGEDGLEFYRLIMEGAPGRLRPGGLLLLELGAGQRADVESIAHERGLSLKGAIKDPAGHDRVLVLTR